MTSSRSAESADGELDLQDLPENALAGACWLVAGAIEPADYQVGLRLLARRGDETDSACVVTTTESASTTDDRYAAVTDDAGGPSPRFVDTISERQYLSAPYGSTPTVFTPGSSDLERIVLALSEVSRGERPSPGARHLLVRSLTPMFESCDVDQLQSVLRRICGLRTESGFGLFGVDYTSIDDAALTALVECVDGVLWITRDSDGTVGVESRTKSAHLLR